MPSGSRLSIVGIGPGEPGLRTIRAEEAIKSADFVVGYRPYLELIGDLLEGKEVFSSGMGKEVERAKAARDFLEEGSVALVSSGDPNVYGMAGLGLEMAGEALEKSEVIPGVTSFTAAACRAGLVFRDSVAVISLSDLLTPWSAIEGRLKAAAEQQLPVALYNPRSKRRDWQLLRALEILGLEREMLVARNVGRESEEFLWTISGKLLHDESLKERIDMTTLLILLGKGTFHGKISRASGICVVGIGPGDPGELTRETEVLLRNSAKLFGAERYLQLVEGVSAAEKVAHQGPCPERMKARLREAWMVAETGGRASILTGGDPSIFSSAWRILAEARGFSDVCISPGVSAFSAVAAKAGAPLVNDFVLLSRPAEASTVSRIAGAGFGVVIYNVRGHELAPLLQEIDSQRPCVLARDVARQGEETMLMTSGDLLEANPSGYRFTLLVASGSSYIKEGRIIARRGYETKYSY